MSASQLFLPCGSPTTTFGDDGWVPFGGSVVKVYLVGGAVRDALLGRPAHEKDWVVVGATPDELLNQRFVQVGKDFPVFLHPKSKEEYALARSERKVGKGYKGFVFDASPSVSLEEDLVRRDLTINAIAQAEDGSLVDPFGGQKDLEARVLRHVSPAFAEDPVRILRIARFLARFKSFGFAIADDTWSLMEKMVAEGEVDALVPERVWKEWQKALGEANPECFVEVLMKCEAWERVAPEFAGSSVRQDVLKAVSGLSDSSVLRFGGLVFDFVLSAKFSQDDAVVAVKGLCDRVRVPNEFADLALVVVRFVVVVVEVESLDAEAVLLVLEQADFFRRPQRFEGLLVVGGAVLACRGQSDNGMRNRWHAVLNVLSEVDSSGLQAKGLKGKAFGDALHVLRLEAIADVLSSS